MFWVSNKRELHKTNQNRYKQDRRKKDNKAKHKATELKEVKMSYKIETHDYEVRLRNAKKFLKQGSRVRERKEKQRRERSSKNGTTERERHTESSVRLCLKHEFLP